MQKINVVDITEKDTTNLDSPHANHGLDIHDPNSYVNFLKNTKHTLSAVSPTFCAAKWLQSTILLYNGETHSCHHPSRHHIELSDIKDNPSGIHNTAHKMKARKELLQGIQTSECDYCWRIENQNSEHISDRIYKSSYSWALPYIDEIVKSSEGKDIVPTYVEVAFESTCNFKCIYCSPESSSRWHDEIRKYGELKQTEYNLHNLDWLKSVGKLPIHHKEYNPYIEAFWKWWPDLYPKLHTFRITGGEPLLSEHTWNLFNYVESHPNKELVLAVNSNLNVPDNKVDMMIDAINRMSSNLKCFDVYTSLENTNDHAEYSRDGMNYQEFISNCYKVLDNTPETTRLHFMTTINFTSAPSFVDFLEQIRKFRNNYEIKKHEFRVRTHLSYLRFPKSLMLSLLSEEDKQRYGDEWLKYINTYKLTDQKLSGEAFYLEEVDQVERLVEFMRNDKQPFHVYDDMRSYIRQLDARRGKNFCETFPMLAYMMNDNYYG
jgi:organic radical activating enzyme